MEQKEFDEKRRGLAAQMATKVDSEKYAKFRAAFDRPVEKPGIWDALKARVSK